MLTRIITAVILGLIFLGAVLAGSYFFDALAVLFAVIGILEMSRAYAADKASAPSIPAGLFVLIAGYAAYLYMGDTGILIAILLGMAAAFTENVIAGKPDTAKAGRTVIMILYPVAPLLAIISMNHLPAEYARTCIMLAVGCSIICDTMALFTGMLTGRHKLAPVISPKKTWEGAAGGLIGSMLFSLLVYFVAGPLPLFTDLPLWFCLVCGALAGVASQLGDLAASSIKRGCGIKDFGYIFPGHGGVLDRIDGMLFSIIAVYALIHIVAGA